MNYELAKELKDSGFSKSHISYGSTNAVDGNGNLVELTSPTLEELIDACMGEYWFTLTELKPHAWRAEGRTLELKALRAEGKTPPEAVAKLWLALNKNKL